MKGWIYGRSLNSHKEQMCDPAPRRRRWRVQARLRFRRIGTSPLQKRRHFGEAMARAVLLETVGIKTRTFVRIERTYHLTTTRRFMVRHRYARLSGGEEVALP